ncbi:MAG: DUF998 domain-containing protein [Candidatus Helarchaeota archaeon]
MKKTENNSFIDHVYNMLTAPKTIKISGYGVLFLYIGLLVISHLIATFLGPEGYSIPTHYISDLGNWDITPTPYLYDLACIFAGTLTIPFIFYIEKHMAPIPQTAEDLPAPHRWTYRLMSLGFFWNILGSIFYIGVGIFSASRDYWNMHDICSIGAFVGFTFAAIFIGFTLIFMEQKIVPKPFNYPIGITGVILPFTLLIYNAIIGGPLLEWLLLFSILIWFIPFTLFTLRHAEKQLHNEK